MVRLMVVIPQSHLPRFVLRSATIWKFGQSWSIVKQTPTETYVILYDFASSDTIRIHLKHFLEHEKILNMSENHSTIWALGSHPEPTYALGKYSRSRVRATYALVAENKQS